ncbi:MAG: hypothetical protein ACPF9D_05790 [Owenweeksia sp.]
MVTSAGYDPYNLPVSLNVAGNSSCANDQATWTVGFSTNDNVLPSACTSSWTTPPNAIFASGTCTNCTGAQNGGNTIDFYIEFPKDHTIGLIEYVFFRNGNEVVALDLNTGKYLPCRLHYCSSTDFYLPQGCIDGVLDAAVTEYSDQITYNYDDIRNESGGVVTVSGGTPITSTAINEYRYGKRGIWRKSRDKKYRTGKTAYSTTTPSTTQRSGYYTDFQYNDYLYDVANDDKWTVINEVTKYSPYGYELENLDALGFKSSAVYAYRNSLAVAVAQNASDNEIGLESFEEFSGFAPTTGSYARLSYVRPGNGNMNISTTISHSGKKSLSLNDDNVQLYFSNSIFTLNSSEEYVVRLWTRNDCDVEVFDGSTLNATTKVISKIDGWDLHEVIFQPTGSNLYVKVTNNTSGGSVFIDDIRIQPYHSSMKGYVYDASTWRLLAELDEQNLATFYVYDEEGKLSQIKRETHRGIHTVKMTRQSLAN